MARVRARPLQRVRNDRMPVERTAEATRASLSLSPPVISNNYGNHYEPRFSHRRCCFPSSAVLFPLVFRYHHCAAVSSFFSLLHLFASSLSLSLFLYVCVDTTRTMECTCTRGHVRKRIILVAFVQFRSLDEPRGRVCVLHISCRSLRDFSHREIITSSFSVCLLLSGARSRDARRDLVVSERHFRDRHKYERDCVNK